MNCIVSTKRKEEDGSYSVLCTCLSCGYSMRVDNKFKSLKCLSCGATLIKSDYMSKKRLEETIATIKKELSDQMQAVERTIAMGFSPANPFQSYRKKKEKYDRISAVPNIIRKMKKKEK
jgi:predicted RNA-binding Zn-ribbon protein involved in translation (DUF1610 family)